MDEHQSEVARLLQQISLEYETAQRGLTGLSAGSAAHTFITAPMEHIGMYHEQLVSQVGEARATQLIFGLAQQHLAEESPPL